MSHIVLALVFFIASVAIHIFYCRHVSMGALQAKAFVLIALFTGVFALAVGFLFLPSSDHGLACTAIVLYILSIPAYLIFYVSTSLMSPSKKILQIIQSKGKAGYDQLLEEIRRENFIFYRLEDLVQSGCVRRSSQRLVLAPSGQGLARVLRLYQKVLGRWPGG